MVRRCDFELISSRPFFSRRPGSFLAQAPRTRSPFWFLRLPHNVWRAKTWVLETAREASSAARLPVFFPAAVSFRRLPSLGSFARYPPTPLLRLWSAPAAIAAASSVKQNCTFALQCTHTDNETLDQREARAMIFYRILPTCGSANAGRALSARSLLTPSWRRSSSESPSAGSPRSSVCCYHISSVAPISP